MAPVMMRSVVAIWRRRGHQNLDRVRHGPAHGVCPAEGNLDVLVKVQPPLSGLQIFQVCRCVLSKAAGVVDVVDVH